MNYSSYIGGTWRHSDAQVEVLDPATERVVGMIAQATIADCIAALDVAAEAAASWAATAPRERAEILRATFEAMRARREQLAAPISAENGKSQADAISEVDYAAEFFRWYSEEAVRIRGSLGRAPAGDKRILTTEQPIGVALLITPWNFPAAMATRKIAPALAAGCTAVLKPASDTPLSAFAVAEALRDAGLPPGVLNVVCPRPSGPAVAAMIGHEALRTISFTGSTEVGSLLLEQAAAPVLRCSMELGGNAPFIVYGGADLERAIDAAMVAKMRNGGAWCIAANRFYVHESVADAFTAQFAARMRELKLGPASSSSATLGPMVSGGERQRVAELVESAVAAGATARSGGHVPAGLGYFYPATVLGGVSADAPLLAELNRGLVSDPAAPFGGVKRSGLGREGGHAGIEEFLETKYVAVDW